MASQYSSVANMIPTSNAQSASGVQSRMGGKGKAGAASAEGISPFAQHLTNENAKSTGGQNAAAAANGASSKTLEQQPTGEANQQATATASSDKDSIAVQATNANGQAKADKSKTGSEAILTVQDLQIATIIEPIVQGTAANAASEEAIDEQAMVSPAAPTDGDAILSPTGADSSESGGQLDEAGSTATASAEGSTIPDAQPVSEDNHLKVAPSDDGTTLGLSSQTAALTGAPQVQTPPVNSTLPIQSTEQAADTDLVAGTELSSELAEAEDPASQTDTTQRQPDGLPIAGLTPSAPQPNTGTPSQTADLNRDFTSPQPATIDLTASEASASAALPASNNALLEEDATTAEQTKQGSSTPSNIASILSGGGTPIEIDSTKGGKAPVEASAADRPQALPTGSQVPTEENATLPPSSVGAQPPATKQEMADAQTQPLPNDIPQPDASRDGEVASAQAQMASVKDGAAHKQENDAAGAAQSAALNKTAQTSTEPSKSATQPVSDANVDVTASSGETTAPVIAEEAKQTAQSIESSSASAASGSEDQDSREASAKSKSSNELNAAASATAAAANAAAPDTGTDAATDSDQASSDPTPIHQSHVAASPEAGAQTAKTQGRADNPAQQVNAGTAANANQRDAVNSSSDAQTQSDSGQERPSHAEAIAAKSEENKAAQRNAPKGDAFSKMMAMVDDNSSLSSTTTSPSDVAAASLSTSSTTVRIAGMDAMATTGQSAQQMSLANSNAIAAEISKFAKNGETRFEIRLDPADLGKIDVRMTIGSDGKTHAHLYVERPDTLDLLSRDQRVLERSLQQSGVNLQDKGGLEYSLMDQGNSGGQQMAGQDRSSYEQDHSSNHSSSSEPVSNTSSTSIQRAQQQAAQRYVATGGLNLVI